MAELLITFKPVILAVHFLAVLFLISVILLQAGKGTDIGTMFGAGGSQSLFGARGAATFLSKLTTITAVVFLITSLSLGTIDNYDARGGSSVIGDEAGAPSSLKTMEDKPADGSQTQPTADPASQPSPAPATTDQP